MTVTPLHLCRHAASDKEDKVSGCPGPGLECHLGTVAGSHPLEKEPGSPPRAWAGVGFQSALTVLSCPQPACRGPFIFIAEVGV